MGIRDEGVNTTMRLIRILLLAALCLATITSAQTGAAKKAAAEAPKELIDINTATADQLKAVPGIGDVYSKKIIEGRPYRAKNELVSKKILPEGVYNKVKDHLIAKQLKK